MTNDVEDRYRGLIRSCMLEVAAGTYFSVDLNARARDALWEVIQRWHAVLARGTVVMIYPSKNEASGFAVRIVGAPLKEIYDLDGLLVTRRRGPGI